MNTLIKDNEVFQKERPTKITKKQRNDILSEVADDIISCNLSKNCKDVIIDDLDKIYDGFRSGYEMAKEIEDSFKCSGTYNITSTLIELLESLDSLSSAKLRENIKLWVKAHNIKPKLSKGQKVNVKFNPFLSKHIGEEVYINRIDLTTASYVVHKDPTHKGGWVVAYEKIEQNLK